MSHVRSLLAALCIGASFVLAGCGSDDDVSVAPPKQTTPTSSIGGGAPVDAGTTPKTCAELRIERADYDELYRELRCQRQRRKLCRGVARGSAYYDDYRCALIRTSTSSADRRRAARKAAAKRKAAATARAQRKAAAAKKAAKAKRVERNGFGGRSTSSRGSSGSSSSSSSGSGSSSYGGGSSSSSSSSSSSRRRR